MKKEELERYFKEYYSLLYRVAFTQIKSHVDTEDVVQEVFVRLLRYQPEFESEIHEKAWLIRTTVNLGKDLIKSKWHSTTVNIDSVPEEEKAYFKVPFIEEDDTLWAVLELSEKYKNCLYLFYYEDYSIKEIGKILEMPENTVKTNLRCGKKELKKMLKRLGESIWR